MEYTVNDMPVLLWQLEDILDKSQGAGNQENKIPDTVRANRRTTKECVLIIQQFYVFSANTCTPGLITTSFNNQEPNDSISLQSRQAIKSFSRISKTL